MKPRQNEDLKNDDSAMFSSSEAAGHIRRMRKVTLLEGRMQWKRSFRTRLPMFVLISQGILIVRRAGMTRMAFKGDVLLLTPGSFELTAVPESADGIVRLEYAKIPMSVFWKQLSKGSAIEEIAVGGIRSEEYNGIHICEAMLPQVARNWQTLHSEITAIESVMNTLNVSLCPVVIPFLRTVYYERRWAFLATMEAHTRQSRPVEFLAVRYTDGRAAFFRDCQLYTGHTPAKWFARRQMELADAWIHVANRTVPEVAALLHYDSVPLFRAAFRKYFHRPPEEPSPMLSSGSLSIDHPWCCMRPFWWPAPLPLVGGFQRSGMRPEEFPEWFEEERKYIEASMELGEELPRDVASESPSDDADDSKPKSISKRFLDLEMIPVADIIPFPTGLPELLRAA